MSIAYYSFPSVNSNLRHPPQSHARCGGGGKEDVVEPIVEGRRIN